MTSPLVNPPASYKKVQIIDRDASEIVRREAAS
jgi:hypothetical protein